MKVHAIAHNGKCHVASGNQPQQQLQQQQQQQQQQLRRGGFLITA